MKKIFAIIALLSILVSCEKELDFRYHDVDSQLVIEGRTSESGTTVTLTRTCPMDEPMDVKPVTDADVILTDLTDGVERRIEINDAGVFHDPVPGIIGHDYQIAVSRGGNRYEATCVMLPATKIVSLEFQWIKMPYDYVAVLQISFLDLESKDDCYWIRLYRNGEPYKWLLSDDRSAVNGVICEVTMTSRKDLDEEDEESILRDGDEVEAVVSPITRNMYDYLVAIQSDSNGPRMFTGDFCLGYYMASIDSRESIIFHPDNLPVFKKTQLKNFPVVY